MRRVIVLPLIALLAGCATSPDQSLADFQRRFVITYYDRNGDGTVDFELHDVPGVEDEAWALSDTKFRGRYNVRLKFGFSFQRERVDLPVPSDVKITAGKPPVFTTQ